MKYANTSFTHLDRQFKAGDEVADDDPLVKSRPDLFNNTPPTKQPKKKRAASPKENA